MSVEIRGLEQLTRKLGKAAALTTIERPMQRSVLRLQRRMQEYPPALAPVQGTAFAPVRFSTRGGASVAFMARRRKPYRRTGTYGRRWTARVTKLAGNGLQGRVGNNVRYAPFVGSERWQAGIHRGRWNTDDRVVREEMPGILADFQGVIDKALEE